MSATRTRPTARKVGRPKSERPFGTTRSVALDDELDAACLRALERRQEKLRAAGFPPEAMTLSVALRDLLRAATKAEDAAEAASQQTELPLESSTTKR